MKRLKQLLVVEDSPTQAVQIRGLLEGSGYSVDVASNGVEALKAIDLKRPDLVITDLQMPEMDGLELVAQIRDDHRDLPVILVTAAGSEEIAVEALKRGAISYVPKAVLSNQLVPTLKEVGSILRDQRSRNELLGRTTYVEVHYALENSGVLLNTVVAQVQDTMASLNLFDENGLIQVGMALSEALDNAMYHGNLEIQSMKSETPMSKAEAAHARASESPYSTRKISMHSCISRSQAEFVVADEGPGFATSKIGSEIADDLNQSGRGINLMRSFMDEVVYNESGNEVRLLKIRQD